MKESRFRIGFEIEKSHRTWMRIGDIIEKGWEVRGEHCGAELVSPVLPLRMKYLEREFNKPEIKRFMDADGNNHCGGHITVSDLERTNINLFNDLAGYFPLIYALFPIREMTHWCVPKREDEYGWGGKGSAVCYRTDSGAREEKGFGIEFRYFDEARNVQQNLDRARLLLYMMKHPVKGVVGAMKLYNKGVLRELLLPIMEHSGVKEVQFLDSVIRLSKTKCLTYKEGMLEEEVNNIKEKGKKLCAE